MVETSFVLSVGEEEARKWAKRKIHDKERLV
jgi:hypothetical protein